MRPVVQRLLREHRVIENAGDLLHDYLVDVMNGIVVPRQAIEAAATTYLLYYRADMQTEDTQIMPRAAELLSEADWKVVADAVPSNPDPLFGVEVGLTYRAMRAQLLLDELEAGASASAETAS